MNKNSLKFLSSMFVLCAFGIAGAHAAPTVKMLGTNTARLGNNATVVTSKTTNSPNQQRLGSIRSNKIGGTTVPVTSTAKTGGYSAGDEARLTLGKYLHTTGVNAGTIKPKTAKTDTTPGSSTQPGTSSSDIVSLTDRVSSLETSIESKQSALSVGDGLIMENDTITLNDDIMGLPDEIDDLQAQIDDKVSVSELTENYYTIEEVNNLIDENGGPGSNTVYDAATGKRRYVFVIDKFNEDVLN